MEKDIVMEYNKYDKKGDIHWQWYLNNTNTGYKSLVNDSLKYFTEKGTVLDIGCGDGLPAYILAVRKFDVMGIDPNASGLTIARERLKHLNFTGYQTTIEDFVKDYNWSFDYMYSLNTIEHVNDPTAFVKIMSKINKFAVVVTDNKDEGMKHPTHTKEYNRSELKELFKDFEIEDIKFTDKWTNDHFIGIKIQ